MAYPTLVSFDGTFRLIVFYQVFFFLLSICLVLIIFQSELFNTSRLTLFEGSVGELLVTEANPEEPGHHRVTGIRLGLDPYFIEGSLKFIHTNNI